MATNQCVPFFKPGQDVSGYYPAPAGGKRFVSTATGGRGSQPYTQIAPAAGPVFGVSSQDAVAGDTHLVFVGGIVPVIAGANLSPNTQVEVGADGTAVPLTTGVAVGYVVAGATTGNAAAIKLYG